MSEGAGYGGNYGNPDTGYVTNPYPAGYGMNAVRYIFLQLISIVNAYFLENAVKNL